MERSIAANNPSDLGAWQDARNQYRNLLVVEKAATAAGENARQGIISPAALRSAVTNIGGRRNFARGQGDFADLARAGEGTMAPLPDSGTASRMESLIPGGLGTATGAGLGSLFGNPMIGAALGAVVPNLAGRAALTSVGRNYLANQVMSGSGLNRAGMAAVSEALLSKMLSQPSTNQVDPRRAALSSALHGQ